LAGVLEVVGMTLSELGLAPLKPAGIVGAWLESDYRLVSMGSKLTAMP